MIKRILCFGDSNTWGDIPGGAGRYDENTRWTQLMQKALGLDYVVIEEGYNGRTSVFFDPIENRMAGIDYFYPCIASQVPLDLVIIMLGSNDLKTRFSVNAWDIASGFERYLKVLQAALHDSPDPQVLLVSPIELAPEHLKHPDFGPAFGPEGVARSKEFAPAYEAFAKKHGLAFLDAAKYGKASPVDGLHMDPASHARLAEAMTAKARELLD